MDSSDLDTPWTKSLEEILAHFGVDSKVGLSADQIEKHVKRYGKNGMLILRESFKSVNNSIWL
jgi:hypothetical protein